MEKHDFKKMVTSVTEQIQNLDGPKNEKMYTEEQLIYVVQKYEKAMEKLK